MPVGHAICRHVESALLTGAVDTERGFGAGIESRRRNFATAPRAFAIAAFLDPQQRAFDRSDLARYEDGLCLQRRIVLRLDRLFRRVRIQGLGKVVGDVSTGAGH